MKTKLSIIVLCLSLVAVHAWGQLDPGPDGLGLYLDMEGTINHVQQESGFLEVHLLLTGCSNEQGLAAWEAGIAFDGPLEFAGYQLPDHCFSLIRFPDLVVGMDYHFFPQQPILHLLTLYFHVNGPEVGNIYLGSISTFDGSGSMGNYLPVYAAPSGEMAAMHPSSGSVDLPVFRVNGEAPVATTSATMDEIKALYR